MRVVRSTQAAQRVWTAVVTMPGRGPRAETAPTGPSPGRWQGQHPSPLAGYTSCLVTRPTEASAVHRPPRRLLVVVAVTGALLVLLPGTALAHASFDVRQVPASSTQDLVLRIPLEREAANDLVEVLVPGAFMVDACDGAEGWSCRQDETSDGDTVLTLERAPDGPGDTELFALTVTAPTAEGVYAFPTIQTYDDGEEASWIGAAGSDQPAPRIQVGDETTEVEFSGDATPHTELAPDDANPSPTPTPSEEASSSPSPTDDPPSPTAAPDAAAGDEDGDGGLSPALVAAIVAAVGIAVGVALTRGRRE